VRISVVVPRGLEPDMRELANQYLDGRSARGLPNALIFRSDPAGRKPKRPAQLPTVLSCRTMASAKSTSLLTSYCGNAGVDRNPVQAMTMTGQPLTGAHKGKHPLCAQPLKVTSLKRPTTWIIPFRGRNDLLSLDAKTCKGCAEPAITKGGSSLPTLASFNESQSLASSQQDMFP
jgi:hypothetical protein